MKEVAKISVIVAAGLAGILCREAAVSEGSLFWLRFAVAATCLTLAMIILNNLTGPSEPS